MCPNIRVRQDDYNEENNYQINKYYNKSPSKNNYQNGIINYNGGFPSSLFDMVQKGEFNVNVSQKKIHHPDGRIEFQSNIGISKNKPRSVVNTYNETKTEVKKDFDIINQTKSYQTGLIFKDTHYYETQKVIPRNTYEKYVRSVSQYDDGTYNYGDWRKV